MQDQQWADHALKAFFITMPHLYPLKVRPPYLFDFEIHPLTSSDAFLESLPWNET